MTYQTRADIREAINRIATRLREREAEVREYHKTLQVADDLSDRDHGEINSVIEMLEDFNRADEDRISELESIVYTD